MTDHPNAAIVRRGYEAFQRGDMETLAEVMSEDVTWHVPGSNPLSGDKKGRDETFAYYGQLAEQTAGTFRVALHDIAASDDHAVGLHRDVATRNGKTLDTNEILVFHIQDGKIVEGWEQYPDMDTVDEFWS
jgi:ketosteroid isomerase-like protein